jgi:hypothetical protein
MTTAKSWVVELLAQCIINIKVKKEGARVRERERERAGV